MKKIRKLLIAASVIFLIGDICAFAYSRSYCKNRNTDERETNQSESEIITEIMTEKNRETESKTETETIEPEIQSSKVIVLDPGHQDCTFPDDNEPIGPGASKTKHKYSESDIGVYSGITEAELCLEVAKQTQAELEGRGYTVYLTRMDNDTLLSSKERADVATSVNADVYLRIHGNYNSDGSMDGATCIVPSSDNPYIGYMYQDCLELAQLVLNAYCVETGLTNDGYITKDDNSGTNWSTVPVALIELGYLSNAGDDQNMADSSFQKKMAIGIADGIDQYMVKRS